MLNTVQDANWLKHTPFAHRGLHNANDAPELSLRSVQLAIENELAVEIDVRLTRDHQVVVFHDRTLQRMTGNSNAISKTKYADLADLFLAKSQEKIPLLADVLKIIDGKQGLLIEIKNERFAGELEKEVAALLMLYAGPVAVMSFNWHTMFWFKRNFPQITRGFVTSRKSKLRIINHVLLLILVKLVKASFLAYDINYLPTLSIKRWNKRRIGILSWTINDLKKLELAKNYADNYIFENLNVKDL